MKTNLRRTTIGFAIAAAASFTMAGLVSAGHGGHEDFHDEFGGTVTDFCDVPGFMVQFAGVADGRLLIGSHGPDGLAYFMDRVHTSGTVTNPDNGRSASWDERLLVKDLMVVDNGDGTLTITVLATGNFVLSGPDGRAIARDPGQTRFQVLIDHGGTPSDPSDDEFLEFLGIVLGSTGRSDDTCAAYIAALT